ncbi:MAG: class I SAM-dependent methyltransferase [Actinomycetota bacterium]
MELSLYHDHARLEQSHWWFVARRAIIGEVLTRHLPDAPDRRILDAGCGTGGMLPMLSRLGHVEGLEAEPSAVAHCREAFADFEVRQGGIPVDVPSGGVFDVVTAFDVIEHIADDIGALEAFGAALRPNGVVVVTVPALPWLWSDHDRVNGHERRYTRQTLSCAFTRSGFNVRHMSYFNTFLLPSVAAARCVQRLRKTRAQPRSDFTMPSPAINQALTRTMAAEAQLVAGRGLPVGVSLIAVAEPTGGGAVTPATGSSPP